MVYWFTDTNNEYRFTKTVVHRCAQIYALHVSSFESLVALSRVHKVAYLSGMCKLEFMVLFMQLAVTVCTDASSPVMPVVHEGCRQD